MKTWILLASLALAASASAQQPVQVEPLTSYQGGGHSVHTQQASGPVTVRWGQPEALSNASDYRVSIADLDRNGDGVLTRDEIPENHALSSEFRLVDRNRDGRITAEELADWR